MKQEIRVCTRLPLRCVSGLNVAFHLHHHLASFSPVEICVRLLSFLSHSVPHLTTPPSYGGKGKDDKGEGREGAKEERGMGKGYGSSLYGNVVERKHLTGASVKGGGGGGDGVSSRPSQVSRSLVPPPPTRRWKTAPCSPGGLIIIYFYYL